MEIAVPHPAPDPDDLPTPSPAPTLAYLASNRHPSVRSAARWLDANPALTGVPAAVARRFESCARTLLGMIKVDDPELTRALSLLTQAKDAAVRAAIAELEH